MTNQTPSEQALLVEYEACQHEASASGSYGWQSGIIFFVTTLALAGTAISYLINTETSLHRLVVIIILGIFSIVVLHAWKKYANRQRFIRRIMYNRMRLIERELGLRKNLYVDFLDEATKDNYKSEKWLPLEEIERETLWEKYHSDSGRGPQGFKWIAWVARFAIGAWIILVILEIGHFCSWWN